MFHTRRPAQRISLTSGAAGLLLLCLATGCGGKPADDDSPSEPAVKEVSADKLPPLADYLPPLDEGRIQIAPPTDWKVLSRDNKYLMRMVRGSEVGLPRILITTELLTPEGIDTATPENVVEFTAKVGAGLKERKAAVLEPALPMVIGENAFARYVLKAKMGQSMIERQVLQTAWQGRMYTVDLQVTDQAEMKKHRDVAYAVAAGLKFIADPAADKPAEEETPPPPP